MNGTALIDALARRVRDTTNFAHARTFLLETINRVRRSVVSATQCNINNTTLTPAEERVIYRVSELPVTDVIRVTGFDDADGRELLEVQWEHLVNSDSEWLHRVGPKPLMWARLGRDLLAVYPAVKAADLSALSVFYIQMPVDLADDAVDVTDVPDEYIPLILDLSEVLVLFRGRIFTPTSAIGEPLKRIAQALGIEVKYGADRQSDKVP